MEAQGVVCVVDSPSLDEDAEELNVVVVFDKEG